MFGQNKFLQVDKVHHFKCMYLYILGNYTSGKLKFCD